MTTTNTATPPQRAFNPAEHLIKLNKKEYLPVQWRLVWFRERYPNGTIQTELVHLDLDRDVQEETTTWNPEKGRNEKVMKQAKGFAVFHATVDNGEGGRATGTKSENAASFSDFIEKAETGSIGRALAALGYGTQFTAGEFDEAHRIVDSPIERNGQAKQGQPQESLSSQVAAAKNRAITLGVARNLAEWEALLARLDIAQVAGAADLAKVNGYLTQVERTQGVAGGGR